MTVLTRHILAEVLKVLALTCTVLVTVIAFGAAIRPLAQNRIGGLDTLKYVALAAIPMLQFALPISAGFAATLVLHRFSADNEIQALSASGVSYRRILRPVAVLGAVLVAFMLVLLFAIEPRFWVVLQSTVTRDAARMFVASIEDGRAFDLGGIQIHADEIREELRTGDSGAERRLHLAGVAVVEFDRAGRPLTEVTAEQATIDVHRTPEGTYLKPVLGQATIFRAADGTLVELPRAELQAARIDRPYTMKPSVMTLGQMRSVVAQPSTYPLVAETLRSIGVIGDEAAAWSRIDAALRSEKGELVFEQPHVRREFIISGARLELERLVPTNGETLRVTEKIDGRPVRTARTPSIQLSAVRADVHQQAQRPSLEAAVVEPLVTFDAVLAEPRPVQLDGAELPDSVSAEVHRWPRRLSGLLVPSIAAPREPSEDPDDLSVRAERLVRLAGAAPGPSARLMMEAQGYQQELSARLDKLRRDLLAEVNGRLARSLAALLLPLLGAVLAIWRRSAQPLEIYILSFVPTIVSILLISAGEQLIRSDREYIGMATLWSGSGLLAVILASSWMKMGRH